MSRPVTINKEAKEYLLSYLQEWLDQLSKTPTSRRKGIVRAIYNKIDSMKEEELC